MGRKHDSFKKMPKVRAGAPPHAAAYYRGASVRASSCNDHESKWSSWLVRDVVLYAVHDLKTGGLEKTGSFSLFHFFWQQKKKKVLPSANARPCEEKKNAEGNEVFQRASSYATDVRNVAV